MKFDWILWRLFVTNWRLSFELLKVSCNYEQTIEHHKKEAEQMRSKVTSKFCFWSFLFQIICNWFENFKPPKKNNVFRRYFLQLVKWNVLYLFDWVRFVNEVKWFVNEVILVKLQSFASIFLLSNLNKTFYYTTFLVDGDSFCRHCWSEGPGSVLS